MATKCLCGGRVRKVAARAKAAQKKSAPPKKVEWQGVGVAVKRAWKDVAPASKKAKGTPRPNPSPSPCKCVQVGSIQTAAQMLAYVKRHPGSPPPDPFH